MVSKKVAASVDANFQANGDPELPSQSRSYLKPDDGNPQTDVTVKNCDYQSDVYSKPRWPYYPVVVWQFWGRAAEAS